MGVTPMSFDAAKRMFNNGLSSFIILWVLSDVVIVDIYCILILASLYDPFGKFGALRFQWTVLAGFSAVSFKTVTGFTRFPFLLCQVPRLVRTAPAGHV